MEAKSWFWLIQWLKMIALITYNSCRDSAGENHLSLSNCMSLLLQMKKQIRKREINVT